MEGPWKAKSGDSKVTMKSGSVCNSERRKSAPGKKNSIFHLLSHGHTMGYKTDLESNINSNL